MSAIKELHELIVDMYEMLCDEGINREVKIERIDEFLDKQMLLLNSISNLEVSEKKLLNEIVKISPKIREKMEGIQADIKKDLARVKNTKKFIDQKPASSGDGTFFDKTL